MSANIKNNDCNKFGNMIAVVGGCMEVSGDLWTIEVTDSEMDSLNDGLYPRKLVGYHGRLAYVGVKTT